VEGGGGGYRCTSAACALREPNSFPTAGGAPVLVDFEQSVLRREDLEGSARVAGAGRRWSIERVPRSLRRLWKPRNRVAAANVETLLASLPRPSPTVLIVGGGWIGNGVEAIYGDGPQRVIAFDIRPTPLVQLVADAHRIPLRSQTVDAVVVQAVLEHVLAPGSVVDEIHRVLRPDGLVYAETPFLHPVHAGPYDFTRFTASGHRYLFRRFDEISAGTVAGPGSQMLIAVDHLVRGLTRSELAGKLARALFFWLRYLDRLIPPPYASDAASAVYFLGRRSENELSPAEIVTYYPGAQAGG